MLSFKPKTITKKLISVLPDRARDVVVSRFGIGDTPEKKTLEAIGSSYGITRERVRQIENHALAKIRASEAMSEYSNIFDELYSYLSELGGVVSEEELLGYLAKKQDLQNHINLLLVLGSGFNREKENKSLRHRWYVDKTLANAVERALDKLHISLSDDDLISEEQIIKSFIDNLEDVAKEYKKDNSVIRRWLGLSKSIGKNPLDEWGLSSSPNVRVKGMRDYAYLVIRQHGSPMHFTEVTKRIEDLFGRKAHVATCHNELIKDDRFVLVGRGLYALKEWGYMSGIVKDVIRQILSDKGPMGRDEIVDAVMKERYVKPNTIIVNLQDTDLFKREKSGKYSTI